MLLIKEAKEEDVNIYLDQQTTYLAHMAGHGKVFEKKSTEKSFRGKREAILLSLVTATAAKVGKFQVMKTQRTVKPLILEFRIHCDKRKVFIKTKYNNLILFIVSYD